jgi:LTXXQ motif family protein
MRVRGLCGAALLLIAASGLGLTESSAHAEGAAPALGAGGSGGREPPPQGPGSSSRRSRSQRPGEAEKWWIHAREVLFEDLELSAEQTRRVDAILEGQQAARRRAEELQAELEAARKRGDRERVASLRQELRANRSQLRNPYARIEQIRALLSPEQRPTFDMNRARLVAEGQQSRKARQAQPAKPPAAGADANAE